MAKEPTKAQLIVNKAKADIIEHIRYEMELIHRSVNNDDECIHTEESDWVSNPTIMVEVQDTYSMDYYEEPRVVTALQTEDNGDITISTDEGDEFSIYAVSINGLQHISDCLDDSFKHIC